MKKETAKPLEIGQRRLQLPEVKRLCMLIRMEMEGEDEQLFIFGFHAGERAAEACLEVPGWLNQVPAFEKGFLAAYKMVKNSIWADEYLRRFSSGDVSRGRNLRERR